MEMHNSLCDLHGTPGAEQVLLLGQRTMEWADVDEGTDLGLPIGC
jgi:hypothetical protein